MLTVACFKWRNPGGWQLPSQAVTTYSDDWVIKLRNGVARHYSKPHRFVCVTDEPADGVECLPLWTDYLHLGGCYNRLKIFSPEMAEILGPRFICIDLDCVITGDLAPIFDRPEPFAMNAYSCPHERDQHYNGSLILMDAGCRAQVWETFDPVESPKAIEAAGTKIVGTDQAWIRLTLGKGEARFTEADGVMDYRHSPSMRSGLPKHAKMVFFSGKRSPQTENKQWISQNWR